MSLSLSAVTIAFLLLLLSVNNFPQIKSYQNTTTPVQNDLFSCTSGISPSGETNSGFRQVDYVLMAGAGYKYFSSYPQDEYKEGYGRWKSSGAFFVSVECLLNRKGTHFLGVEANVYNTGDYKAVITDVVPSIGYRYKYFYDQHYSLSAKFALNLISVDFFYFGFTHQALILEYNEKRVTYFIQYRTDVLSTSPNFIFAGAGINF